MASKKLRLKHRRIDGAYIFASVFAVFGGLALLGTYAYHAPPSTFSQGIYSLSKFGTTETSTFSFGIKQGMTYCLSPIDQKAQILVTAQDTRSQSLTSVADQACFVAAQTYEKATIQVVNTQLLPTSLVVK
ncbi:MAG: hypothetical protein AAB436_00775 [Patescibacteria group bacterium]